MKKTLIMLLLLSWGATITVNAAEDLDCTCPCECEDEEVQYDYSDDIIITEIMPNPEEEESENEFVELKNKGTKDVNLLGWQLKDASTKVYTIEAEDFESTTIKAGKYFVVYRSASAIALNNSGDEVNLYDPDEKLMETIVYEESAPDDYSYARESGEWFWTSEPTPGEANTIVVDEEEEEGEEEEENGGDENEDSDEEEEEESTDVVSIKEARELEKNTEVKVQGTVTVEPDILGSQFFYIQDEESGIQIYSSKKYFPDEMKVGDLVKVNGKVSEASNEKKINISLESDIEIMESGNDLSVLEINELGEDYEGHLAVTQGQILDLASTKITLSNDVLVYIKSGVEFSKSDYEEGDLVKVIGIVGQYKDDYRLMPRSSDDIETLESVASIMDSEGGGGGIIKAAQAAEVGGQDSFIDLTKTDNKNILLYLLIIVAVLVVAMGALIYKTGIWKDWLKRITDFAAGGEKSTKEKDGLSQYRE